MTIGMKGSHVMVSLVGLVLFVTSIVVLVDSARDNYALYVAESECVAEYTRLGIERSEISTGMGTCWRKYE